MDDSASAEGQPWLADLTPLERTAALNAFALYDTGSWLHRRVERLSWAETRTLRDQFTIDFTVPPDLAPVKRLEDELGVFFVPVAVLRKWPPLSNFSLTDPSRTPLPLLTSRKNRRVDAAVLKALAPPGNLRDQVEDDLRNIALRDQAQAETLLDEISTSVAGARGSITASDWGRWKEALRVAATVVGNSILWVRVVGAPRDRMIVKCSFDYEGQVELLFRRRLLSAFSWSATRAYYELANLGERGSFHLEIIPPPGLHIRRAGLELGDAPPSRPGPVSDEAGPIRRRGRDVKYAFRALREGIAARWKNTFRSVSPEDARDRASKNTETPAPGKPYAASTPDRAHLYVGATQDQFGLAEIEYAVDRDRISGSVAAGIAVSALLTFFAAAAPAVSTHIEGAVTILLLLPALLGYLVVRPGEHPETRRHLVGVRTLVLAVGGLPVMAAAALVGLQDAHLEDVGWWWTGFAVAAWILTALLAASWILPPDEIESED